MKRIMVSLDDETYRRARMRASELGTSITTLARNYLLAFAGGQTDFERRRKLQERALASIESFRGGSRLTRGRARPQRTSLRASL
jgi:hypothetical protein